MRASTVFGSLDPPGGLFTWSAEPLGARMTLVLLLFEIVFGVGVAVPFPPRGERSRELTVRNDAVISDSKCRIGHHAPPLRRGPYARRTSVSIAN